MACAEYRICRMQSVWSISHHEYSTSGVCACVCKTMGGANAKRFRQETPLLFLSPETSCVWRLTSIVLQENALYMFCLQNQLGRHTHRNAFLLVCGLVQPCCTSLQFLDAEVLQQSNNPTECVLFLQTFYKSRWHFVIRVFIVSATAQVVKVLFSLVIKCGVFNLFLFLLWLATRFFFFFLFFSTDSKLAAGCSVPQRSGCFFHQLLLSVMWNEEEGLICCRCVTHGINGIFLTPTPHPSAQNDVHVWQLPTAKP